MGRFATILTIFCLLTGLTANGQLADVSCGTVYKFAEIMPQYDKGTEGLFTYLTDELTPLLSDYFKRDSILIASMHLTLTIDKQGHVAAVDFQRTNATQECKNKLRQKIMTMTGWEPGQIDEQPVCCEYVWPISCILWE